MREQESHKPLPLAVLVQPDPMIEERAGPWRTAAIGLAACAIVVLVLYGMSRPEQSQQMTAVSTEALLAAPAGGAASNASGGTQAANAPAQNLQPNSQQSTTTGKGSGGSEPSGSANGHAGKPQSPPTAGGGAAGNPAGPGMKPAPQAR